MNNRIKDKIEEIEKYLSELSEIMPSNYESYISDLKEKAACERYAEKITQAIIDLAFLVIKDKKLKAPEDDAEAFQILLANKVISPELADKLQDAKGMRNILAHKYGEIDDEIVFNSITEELQKDSEEFIKAINNAYL